ncbi:MAG: aldolase [Chloroflexi bacterium HGW-Chloroflexi-10]|nr:MAG: aldolase [Chloroflexi bacterium HGW-Chloroflexi-10]
MNETNYHSSQEQIARIMKRIYQQGLTSLSGGNISTIDTDKNFFITPTAVDKGNLSADDVVYFNASGEFFGKRTPSSEYPFHMAIYRQRPDVRAIVHTHSPALIAFSIAGKTPDPKITPITQQVCSRIGFVAYAPPGSQMLGELVAAQFTDGTQLVIMENHGAVAVGPDLQTAYQCLETLEYSARALIYAHSLGDVQSWDSNELQHLWENPPYFEKEILPETLEDTAEREMICAVVQRAYQRQLMVSTTGSASVRLNADQFLITPSNQDRCELQAQQLTRIDGEHIYGNHPPSRAYRLHQEIYQQHQDVNAILTSQAPYATAFAITNTRLNTRSIPESYMLLRNVQQTTLEDVLITPEKAAKLIGENHSTMIILNLGILVTGKTLMQAYDRLEVAEFTARSIIEAQVLGGMKPIREEEIRRLDWL